jgi:putative transposase
LDEQPAQASPDVLRGTVKTFAEALMSAEADAGPRAGHGERSLERVTKRNGYRAREWATRAGTIESAIPRLREGSYFPDFLIRQRRAEQALVSVVATSYLLGVSDAASGEAGADAGHHQPVPLAGLGAGESLDTAVQQFRSRPLDGRSYQFVQADALTIKVWEGARTVIVDGLTREILGFDVTSAEDGAGWLAFFRSLVTRGLTGVVRRTRPSCSVVSDARAGPTKGPSSRR